MLHTFAALITYFCSQMTLLMNVIGSVVEALIFTCVDNSVILLILFIIVIMQFLEQHSSRA